uniref:Galectin n=1 Tax=Panagrellus redivivus TaxID=6233 RepID=A0A7E4VEJ3_PANRE
MNRVFAIGSLLFVVASGLDMPPLDDHVCLDVGWVAQGNSFVYQGKRKQPLSPARTFYKNDYPYFLAHILRKYETVYLRGTMHPNAQTWWANLMAGSPDDYSGIEILHFTGEMRWSYTDVRSRTSDWHSHYKVGCPFAPGKPFDIRIRALEDSFEIRYNHHLAVNHEYTLPLNMVRYVRMVRDLTLDRAYVGGQKFAIPYRIELPEGRFEIGDSIKLNAVPIENEMRISLMNVNQSATMEFKIQLNGKYASRNTENNGYWGNEERGGGFPFEKNVEFELDIENAQHGLLFSVNGNRFATYMHRVRDPEGEYMTLQITGQIEPTLLAYCKGK